MISGVMSMSTVINRLEHIINCMDERIHFVKQRGVENINDMHEFYFLKGMLEELNGVKESISNENLDAAKLNELGKHEESYNNVEFEIVDLNKPVNLKDKKGFMGGLLKLNKKAF